MGNNEINEIINYIERKMYSDFDHFTNRVIYGKSFEDYQQEYCQDELRYISYLKNLEKELEEWTN